MRVYFGILILLFFPLASYGCLGARPLGLGGAYIASCAGDAHAAYWNPAGFAYLKSPQFTSMITSNNRLYINYQQWLVFAIPLPKNAGIGLSYIYDKKPIGSPIITKDGIRILLDKKSWYTFSFGKYKKENFAVGINLRYVKHEFVEAILPFPLSGKSVVYGKPEETTSFEVDVGIFLKISQKLNLGFLIQDINEPEAKFAEEYIIRYPTNIRCGIAYNLDNSATLMVDLYDLTWEDIYSSHSRSPSSTELRIGLEKRLSPELTIYFGSYGKHFYTLGLGYKFKYLIFDWSILTTENTGTHLFSVTIK
jgi:hypothetical protein